MADEVIRIFSDLHYGDHSSRVVRTDSLAPLAEGATSWIVNGDALDTRPGPRPDFNRQCREEIDRFFASAGLPTTFITGNHDPDISDLHSLELAQGRVFVTHGDILYDEVVPWGRDAPAIRRQIIALRAEAIARHGRPLTLEEDLALVRGVAARVRQRHQAERRRTHYFGRLAIDLLWPPWRFTRILSSWASYPGRARRLCLRFRPQAAVVINGHTHWQGIWREKGAPIVINTGCLCRPFGASAVDLIGESVVIRRIVRRSGEFRIGPTVVELRLPAPVR